MQKAPNASQRPFSPPSFPARRKRRGRRRRVRNDHDGTSRRRRVRNDHDGTSRRKRRLLSSVLISSFPNRKLNLRFGFYGESAATSQSRLRRASIPTPFVPSGHFPLIGGIGPWKGSLFLQLFPLLPAENHPGGRRGGKTGRRVRTSARSTRTFCTPQNKKRETVHIAAGSALVGGYFV